MTTYDLTKEEPAEMVAKELQELRMTLEHISAIMLGLAIKMRAEV